MNKLIKFFLWILLVLFCTTGVLFIYLYNIAIIDPPLVNESGNEYKINRPDSNFATIDNNWIRKSNNGLWEMYLEGEAYERGIINGMLSRDLIHEQEEAFSDQINKLVPSSFYRHFLKYFIAWFNRNLDKNITEEYKQEIYGISKSASSEFDYVGPAYQRIMNYHAAHDIGHALQNLALVGCSSFATWDKKSEGNSLFLGRNFDFYVGDRFAKNKIVSFVKPINGYPFMMITWGGMIGVVSGMNLQGLTVTLNAAKSELPSGSATPVSLLAREILQYAKNIDEALAIASKRKTFVAESFLIGSANDNKAVSIEITPDTIDVYDPGNDYIICTNHYESNLLGPTPLNTGHKSESASLYRYNRIKELVDTLKTNTPEITASILRNRYGLGNNFIGNGNEKAINQLIAHHSVIFNPTEKIVWVSTGPWQLGAYAAYRLDDIFSLHGMNTNHEIADSMLTIPADSFLLEKSYEDFLQFRALKADLEKGIDIDPYKLIEFNPQYYHAYVLAGDYLFARERYREAGEVYRNALTKEIASEKERNYIREKLNSITKQAK